MDAVDRFYIALFSTPHARADSLCLHVILHEWIAFYSTCWNIHWSGVLTASAWLVWCHVKLLPSRRVLCTPNNHAPCHFVQSSTPKVHACLAVTCHLYFWKNDQDLLWATAVTRGWDRHWNKSRHWKLTLEKKVLLLLQGFEPTTFQSWVQCSNHWSIRIRSGWMEGWIDWLIDWLIFFTTILMIWWMD